MASSSPSLGVRNPHTKLQSLLQYLRASNLADTFTGTIRTKAHYVGVSRDCPIFREPLLYQEQVKLRNFKFGRNIHRVHPSKSSLNILEKKECGRIQGQPKFLGTPLSHEQPTGKATNVKFCTHIHSINRKKSPLKISGKLALGIVMQGLPKISRALIYRAHRAVIFEIAQLSC